MVRWDDEMLQDAAVNALCQTGCTNAAAIEIVRADYGEAELQDTTDNAIRQKILRMRQADAGFAELCKEAEENFRRMVNEAILLRAQFDGDDSVPEGNGGAADAGSSPQVFNIATPSSSRRATPRVVAASPGAPSSRHTPRFNPRPAIPQPSQVWVPDLSMWWSVENLLLLVAIVLGIYGTLTTCGAAWEILEAWRIRVEEFYSTAESAAQKYAPLIVSIIVGALSFYLRCSPRHGLRGDYNDGVHGGSGCSQLGDWPDVGNSPGMRRSGHNRDFVMPRLYSPVAPDFAENRNASGSEIRSGGAPDGAVLGDDPDNNAYIFSAVVDSDKKMGDPPVLARREDYPTWKLQARFFIQEARERGKTEKWVCNKLKSKAITETKGRDMAVRLQTATLKATLDRIETHYISDETAQKTNLQSQMQIAKRGAGLMADYLSTFDGYHDDLERLTAKKGVSLDEGLYGSWLLDRAGLLPYEKNSVESKYPSKDYASVYAELQNLHGQLVGFREGQLEPTIVTATAASASSAAASGSPENSLLLSVNSGGPGGKVDTGRKGKGKGKGAKPDFYNRLSAEHKALFDACYAAKCCYYFNKGGECSKGDKCNFKHEKVDPKKPTEVHVVTENCPRADAAPTVDDLGNVLLPCCAGVGCSDIAPELCFGSSAPSFWQAEPACECFDVGCCAGCAENPEWTNANTAAESDDDSEERTNVETTTTAPSVDDAPEGPCTFSSYFNIGAFVGPFVFCLLGLWGFWCVGVRVFRFFCRCFTGPVDAVSRLRRETSVRSMRRSLLLLVLLVFVSRCLGTGVEKKLVSNHQELRLNFRTWGTAFSVTKDFSEVQGLFEESQVAPPAPDCATDERPPQPSEEKENGAGAAVDTNVTMFHRFYRLPIVRFFLGSAVACSDGSSVPRVVHTVHTVDVALPAGNSGSSMQAWRGLAMLDTGAGASLCSRFWLQDFLGGAQMHETPTCESFQFGAGSPVDAVVRVFLPVRFEGSSAVHRLEVKIVEHGFLPLMIGWPDHKRLGISIDNHNSTSVSVCGDSVEFDERDKHLFLKPELVVDRSLVGIACDVAPQETTWSCTVAQNFYSRARGYFRQRACRVWRMEPGSDIYDQALQLGGVNPQDGLEVVALSKPENITFESACGSSVVVVQMNKTQQCVSQVVLSEKVVDVPESEKFPVVLVIKHPSDAVLPVFVGSHQVQNRDDIVESMRFAHWGCKIKDCRTCRIAAQDRRRRMKTGAQSAKRAEFFGEIVACDIVGPIAESVTGARYAVVLVDYFSRRGLVAPIPKKSDAYKALDLWQKRFGAAPKAVRTDQAKEFLGGTFAARLREWDCRVEHSCPYRHNEQGTVERYIRELTRRVRILLYEGGLPHAFWSIAIVFAAHIIDLVPHACLGGISPVEKSLEAPGSSSNLGSLADMRERVRAFGAFCWYTPPAETSPKLVRFNSKRKRGLMLGICALSGSFIVGTVEGAISDASKNTTKIGFSKEVWVDESNLRTARQNFTSYSDFSEVDDYLDHKFEDLGFGEFEDEVEPAEPAETTSVNVFLSSRITEAPTEGVISRSDDRASAVVLTVSGCGVSASSGVGVVEEHLSFDSDDEDGDAIVAKEKTDVKIVPVPRRLVEFAHQAREAECDSWEKHKCIESVDEADIPSDATVITSKWVDVFKPTDDPGKVVDVQNARKNSEKLQQMGQKKFDALSKELPPDARIKSRLTARGFQETYLSFAQRSSPTAKLATLRLLVYYLVVRGWMPQSFDVPTAFLRGVAIARSLFIRVPAELQRRGYSPVCRVVQPVYGLADAPLNFFLKISASLTAAGFRQSAWDGCLFIRDDCVVLLHVDDAMFGCFCLSDGSVACDALRRILEEYEVTAMESGSFRYCGSWVDWDAEKKTIDVHQQQYIETIGLMTVPAGPKRPLTQKEVKDVQAKVGELGWVARSTRFDFGFVVSDFLHRVRTADTSLISEINKEVRRMHATKCHRLRYRNIGDGPMCILTFTDASHGGRPVAGALHFLVSVEELVSVCLDPEEGGVLNAVLIDWSASAIRRVSLSTFASETLACVSACDSAFFLTELAREFFSSRIQAPLVVSDSKNLVDTIRTSNPRAEEKRLLPYLRTIKELAMRGEIRDLLHVSADYMLADCLTKKQHGVRGLVDHYFQHGVLRLRFTSDSRPVWAVFLCEVVDSPVRSCWCAANRFFVNIQKTTNPMLSKAFLWRVVVVQFVVVLGLFFRLVL